MYSESVYSFVSEMLKQCLRQSRTTAEVGSEDLKQTKIVLVQTLSERVGRWHLLCSVRAVV